MKKCVQDGPVTPMADDWWDTILTMIPAKLVSSAALQPHIKELYNEVKGEYEASIRKAMGENENENENTVQVRDKQPTYTQNACTIFGQMCVKKRVPKHAHECICAHFMHMFPFGIRSHDCAFCGILLPNKKRDKRQFLQTLLKKSPTRNQQAIRTVLVYSH